MEQARRAARLATVVPRLAVVRPAMAAIRLAVTRLATVVRPRAERLATAKPVSKQPGVSIVVGKAATAVATT